jgi:hypothetical protein
MPIGDEAANRINADARRLEAAEAALNSAQIELQRYHASELPGGWTAELQGQIDARHAAEAKLSAAEAEIARLWKPGVYYHCPACNHPTPVSDILNAAEVVDARQREGSTGTPGKAHIVKFR